MTQAMATSTPLPADHDARAEFVEQIAFRRDQPGLGQNENSKRHLNCGTAPVVLLVHRIDEKGPTVLQVGNHHHADDAKSQLPPSRRHRRGARTAQRVRCRDHFHLMLDLIFAWYSTATARVSDFYLA